MLKIQILAPAKINLGLSILEKLPNGYHKVDSVMQAVSLYDKIEIKIEKGNGVFVEHNEKINCDMFKNTAYKAAKLFIEAANLSNISVKIYIEKNIPSQAGLAGGSSDAASVLKALNSAFNNILNREKILDLGLKIGSDVPFCLLGGMARVQGIGEKLEKIAPLPPCKIIIIKPKISISTKEAYNFIDKLNKNNENNIENLIKCTDLISISKNIFNDFERILPFFELENKISKIKSDLIKLGALGSAMTGSGSAVFGIFDDFKKAKKSLGNFKEAYLCEPI